jgi:hydrogenase-4 component F
MIVKYYIVVLVIICAIMLSKSKWFTSLLSAGFIVLQLLLTCYAYMHKGATDSIYFTFDDIGLIFLGVLAILCTTSFYHSLSYLKYEPINNYNIYQIGFLALLASITGVYLSNNLTLSWIFMEATTLSVAALIYHNRTILTLEATWKYIFICSTGIALAYLGILFLSMAVKGLPETGMSYSSLINLKNAENSLYLKLAFIFILVGYSAKMEIFPLYTIGIDANYVAPAPASAFISTALVNAGFVSIFRVYKVLMPTAIGSWMGNVLLICGILSLLVAAIYMQRVKNFKRLLAYSTVENMGLVCIGLGLGGHAVYAALLLVILHSFVKSSMFYQFGQAHKILKTYKIFRTGDYLKLNPIGAMVLLIGLIVLTGIPPSGLFIPEFLIFKTSILSGHWILFIFIALFMCLIIYGMSSKILQLIFTPMDREVDTTIRINPWQTITQFIMLGFVLYMCFNQPQFLKEMIENAVKIGLK